MFSEQYQDRSRESSSRKKQEERKGNVFELFPQDGKQKESGQIKDVRREAQEMQSKEAVKAFMKSRGKIGIENLLRDLKNGTSKDREEATRIERAIKELEEELKAKLEKAKQELLRKVEEQKQRRAAAKKDKEGREQNEALGEKGVDIRKLNLNGKKVLARGLILPKLDASVPRALKVTNLRAFPGKYDPKKSVISLAAWKEQKQLSASQKQSSENQKQDSGSQGWSLAA